MTAPMTYVEITPLHTTAATQQQQTENCLISECVKGAAPTAGTTKKGGMALRHYV